jgi:hypothetical protein
VIIAAPVAPSPKEIKAVRSVLYDRPRLRKIFDHLRSIDVLMNTNPDARLQPNDRRVKVGAGPFWFEASGALNRGVVEAAKRCAQVADLTLEIRRDLAKVAFNAKDKQYLRAALDAQAKAWRARGRIWTAPGDPNVAAAVAEISRYDGEAIRNYQKVKAYLTEVKGFL